MLPEQELVEALARIEELEAERDTLILRVTDLENRLRILIDGDALREDTK